MPEKFTLRKDYKVIETVCYPAQFKVESVQHPGNNNSWTEYRRTMEEAQVEADRRNAEPEPT